MNSIHTFYIKCPVCEAELAGKLHESLGINCTELYSDGKMICDELLSEPQLIVQCPSCSHIFWKDETVSLTVSDENSDQGTHKVAIYPYSSWYLFGTNPNRSQGKIALIQHFTQLLSYLRPLNSKQEIYLRKSLLWAYNDLLRRNYSFTFLDFLKGKISYGTWRHERNHRLKEKFYFLKYTLSYKSNIKRIIDILRSAQDKEVDKVYLAELYRIKGNFDKAIEILNELNRSTHYVTMIRSKALKRNSTVFKVAG
jgi:hypothetical protein